MTRAPASPDGSEATPDASAASLDATLASQLKTYARAIGFHLVGITSPEPFEQAELDLQRWLGEGHQGQMAWMNDARARLSCRPLELLPSARSLVVVGVSYRTVEPAAGARIARYAWGDDYHDVLKARLRQLAAFLGERAGSVNCRVFVDSGPLVERDAAVRAGLGFRGKNTNLLTPIGSYVFLGALLTDVALEFDTPVQKDCGSCRLCLDACPTDALAEPYHLAAERCIAYLTIEHRGPIASELRPRMGEWVFGCDVCQEVCPYNRLRAPASWPEFTPRPAHSAAELLQLDDESFRQTFRRSPIKRAKRRGLARNAAIALGNSGEPSAIPALEHAAQHGQDEVVRESAAWALARLGRPQAARSQAPSGDQGALRPPGPPA